MALHFDSERKYKILKSEIEHLHPRKPFRPSYKEYHKKVKEDISTRLSEIINPEDGIIDGDTLKSLIFPTSVSPDGKNYNVFISHSHNDLDKAKELAKYLYEECGQFPFLDDDIWHSADGLLELLDDAYCRIENQNSYNYRKRNFSTSHVHTMLSMAILEMIAQCESFIFIESAESLDFNTLKETGRKTQSPWIYQELQFAQMLSKATQPVLEQRQYDSGGKLRISYKADTTGFKKLNRWNVNIEFGKALIH